MSLKQSENMKNMESDSKISGNTSENVHTVYSDLI